MLARKLRGWIWGAVFSAFWRRQLAAAGTFPRFSTLIRHGLVYDGLGGAPRIADVGIAHGRIAAIGDLAACRGLEEIDAAGLAVAPGFINPLSWATESLIADPHGESDLRQGVTLEVFGEGLSMGPITPAMRRDMRARQRQFRYDIEWTTLGEYLEFLERRGVTPNVASYVGATSVRIHELGYADRAPTPAELARMCELVRAAVREGALGVGSALIYAPAAYAAAPELTALALAAAEFGGGYSTHLRNESGGLLAAIDEVIAIARATRRHVEIHHLKAAGPSAWPLLDAAIARIEAARAAGLDIGANMYPYEAAASGLDAAMPPWVQEGGHDAWIDRLRQPDVRARVIREIAAPEGGWQNLYRAAGSAERVLLLGFRNPRLACYQGLTLAQIAQARGRGPEETIVDLVVEDHSRVNAAYFLMSEENVRRQLALPWIALCSDAESLAPSAAFAAQHPHPRAYGAFARFLGHYSRDLELVSLPRAIQRITALPAANLGIAGRGVLRVGNFADVVVFDPTRIADHATYAAPHRFASGVQHVYVNGVAALRDGTPTRARSGRVVRGPGWAAAHERPAALELPRAAG